MRLQTLIIFSSLLWLTSCARSCQSLERNTLDNRDHKIRITQYSGGKQIGQWTIDGIVNNSQHSDGYYFYVDGHLIEISGDVTLEYLD